VLDLPLACMTRVFFLLVAGCTLCLPAGAQRLNWFNDPFARATSGFDGCPVPEGPLLTEAEMRREGHHRAERGTTCWLAKKCDTPNAYLNDGEINAAVVAAIAATPRLRDSSVWVTTQRRFVTLQGCMRSEAQRQALVRQVRSVARVDYVIDELQVGTSDKPPYRVKR
jgi:hypothetical protein